MYVPPPTASIENYNPLHLLTTKQTPLPATYSKPPLHALSSQTNLRPNPRSTTNYRNILTAYLRSYSQPPILLYNLQIQPNPRPATTSDHTFYIYPLCLVTAGNCGTEPLGSQGVELCPVLYW